MGRLSPGQWFEVGAWLVVAGAAYGFSLQFDRDIEMYRFGAAGWPRLIILLIALGALGQFVQDLRRAQDKPLSEQGMGYYFLTPLFLIAYLYLTGEHRIKPLILVPLFLYLVVTFIFTRLLYVGLPTGYWPGFYDFGTWFVVLVRGT
jgi:hypothetical protein